MGPINQDRFDDQMCRQTSEHRTNTWIFKAVFGVASLAGTVVMIHLLLVALNHAGPAEVTQTGTFVTRLGEHRCENLPEKSQVCLNTDTVVRFAFNGNTRNVEVVSGEASFVVQQDLKRPLKVLGGGAETLDLSTSFDVYKKANSTLVTVITGSVKIRAAHGEESRAKFRAAEPESNWDAAPQFHRLQQVEFDEKSGTLLQHRALTEQGLAQFLAWQRGRIDLSGRTLGEALDEFARYQPINQFKFEDRALRKMRLGGELETTNLMDFLNALKHEFDIRYSIKTVDGNTVVTLSHSRSGDANSESAP